MDADNNPDIQIILNQDAELFEIIKKKTTERMKFDEIDKDPRLNNPSDPYYNKPLEFGLHKIAYFMCFKCKKPYYAGLRDCAGGPADNEQNQNKPSDFDPTHLICGGCVDLSGVAGVTDCKVHGKVIFF
jgi:E3 ubiquitin-protein ligase MYCBP2